MVNDPFHVADAQARASAATAVGRTPDGPFFKTALVKAQTGGGAKPAKATRPSQPEALPQGPTLQRPAALPHIDYARFATDLAYRRQVQQQTQRSMLPVAEKPSESQAIGDAALRAIGPDVLKQAANPRVAGLQTVLGTALDVFTGIPTLVNAAETHNAGAAGIGLAGLLPFAKPAKFLKLGESVAKRTAEEAAQHVVEASAAARAEGKGISGAQRAAAILVKPGVVTPETGGELGAKVRQALRGGEQTAAQARIAQEALRAPERAKRAAAAAEAMQSHTGVESYLAARAKMVGKLPQINWQGFREFGPDALDAALEHIKNSPNLRTFEKANAQEAILNAITDAKVPTASEQKLLERVFGRQVTSQLSDAASGFGKYKDVALEVLNVPRAIQSSADLSAPLRQGLVAAVTHPVIVARNIGPMIRAAGSERVFQEAMQAIRDRPTFPLMDKAGLPLTDIGTATHGVALTGREEKFASNLAEHLNLRDLPKIGPKLGRYGTGPGDVIRASDRAYVMFLNQTRADLFDSLIHDAALDGRDLTNTKLIKDIARFVGSATGRGPLGAFQKHAVTINALFFSPRLLASRLDILLSPVTYLNADPFVRRQALQALFNLVGTMSLVLKLAQLNGASVGTDPTSANFAKIRIGNTRIDIAGGFQQYVRLAFELAEGKVTSSTTGESMALSGGIGKTSPGDVALRFAFSKLGPVPSFVAQASGVSQASFGPKQSLRSQALQRLIPLLAQDANDLRTTPGAFGGKPSLGKAVAGYGLGLFGIGEQTYAQTPKKSRGGGATDPFNVSGGSAGIDPFNVSP